MIKKCSCKNDYQDEKYGEGMRVQNPLKDPGKYGYRCTVCSKVNK